MRQVHMMSEEQKNKIEERLLLETLRNSHRIAEAETILAILESQSILTAEQARSLVRRRLEALTTNEASISEPLSAAGGVLQ